MQARKLFSLATLLPPLALAGRPLNTEDASTPERTREAGQSATTAMFVQGKHAFRNVGAARIRDEGRNLTLRGVAAEKPVTARLTLLDGFDVGRTWATRSGGTKGDDFRSAGFHRETGPPSR